MDLLLNHYRAKHTFDAMDKDVSDVEFWMCVGPKIEDITDEVRRGRYLDDLERMLRTGVIKTDRPVDPRNIAARIESEFVLSAVEAEEADVGIGVFADFAGGDSPKFLTEEEFEENGMRDLDVSLAFDANDLEQLRGLAAREGIKVDGRWRRDKLRDRILEARNGGS